MLIQRSIQLTTLALTLLLAAMAAKWTWQLVALSNPSPIDKPQANVAAAGTNKASAPDYSLNTIIDAALFGKASAKPVTPVVKAPVQEARPSRSRLQLIGVIGGSKGAAIIRNGNKQNTYLVGEYMDKNQSLQLVSVASDHAILLRSGVPERLTLVGARKSSQGINTATPKRPDETRREVDLGEARFKRLIGDARQTLTSNPLKLTRFMNIRPVQKNGKLQGYSLNSGQDRRLFQALGLQTGDLISSINGRSVSDMQLPDVYASLQQQDSVQIEIIRGLESGDYFGYQGEIHDMPANKMCPVPTARTDILIGGHAEPALKRAARVGDGWMCAGADLEQLEAYIKRINQLREEYGTADKPFKVFTTGQNAFTPEGIAQLEEIGVTDVIIAFRNVYEMEPDKPLEEKIGMLNWYANEFISG